jgi:ribosomal protein S18 acetylase RimI-like enzyme
MVGNLEIKELKHINFADVARIHILAFPDSFITKLGIECVRMYYVWQLKSPDHVYAIGVFENEKMLGFCFGGVFTMALGGYLSKNRKLVIKRLLLRPFLLFNITFWGKLYRGLILSLKFQKKNLQQHFIESRENKIFGILSIATDPKFQGKGAGRILIEEAERYARYNNYSDMQLSVNPNNKNAVNFYEHLGWQKENELDKWTGRMKKKIFYD